MKRIMLVCLLVAGIGRICFAQTVSFYLYLPTDSIIDHVSKSVGAVTPVFSDSNINEIISNYDVTKFNKAFPISNYQTMRKFYIVESNSLQLAEDLHSYSSEYFPYYEVKDSAICTGYTPNDWGIYYADYLDFIKTRDAWSQTKGDTSIVVGVSDNYFNLSHEDLAGKIAQVGRTVYDGGDYYHGTLVAGIVGAATDNGKGFPSIGFKCRLDVTTRRDDSALLLLSLKNHRRIINASWIYSYVSPVLNLDSYLISRHMIDEIYENGTVLCMAAGNGRPGIEKNSHNYTYPSSFNHVISTTQVGWENDTSLYDFNTKFVHEITQGDTETVPSKVPPYNDSPCYQHNYRVDICAPSVRIGGLFYDPGSLGKLYETNPGGWGTSFGSPMVAGACGLMLGVNPYLSPYQIEYILKQSATDIYDVSWNKKYKGTNRFNGRLGAGLLNVDSAISMARDFNPNFPNTYTFRIKGVDVNTRCAPDSFAGVPKPILKLLLEYGTPPYTYKWEPYPDNRSTLTYPNGQNEPTVYESHGTHLVHYYVTVYDNSDIQKVASKEIRIQLRHDSTADLCMRDAYADMFNEPNDMDKLNPSDWNFWESPDIWNRQHQDGITTHEDPEYFSSAPNYLYIRIKNSGCAATTSEKDLKLYWTVSSTGETWPIDWDGSTTIKGQPGGGVITPTLNIPILGPGQDTVLYTPWYPPMPQDYDTTITDLDVCVLARIETAGGPNYGMTFPEDSVINHNIVNNNNVITRNLIVTNLNTSNKSHKSIIVVGNSSGPTTNFSLQVVTDKMLHPHYEGNLGTYLTVKLELGSLYYKWVDGGRAGNVSSYNDSEKSVTYELNGDPMRLDNLFFSGGEKFIVYITFTLREDVLVSYPITDDRIFIRQLIPYTDSVDNGDGTKFAVERDFVYGNVSFQINIDSASGGGAKPSSISGIKQDDSFMLYPNPTTDKVFIIATGNNWTKKVSVIDVAGKTVLAEKAILTKLPKVELSISSLAAGVYMVRITDQSGKSHSIKFIKE